MKVEIESKDLMDLLWMARRYADGRSTYVPSVFNEIYEKLLHSYPELINSEREDGTLDYFPYAQDGMYNKDTGSFDARPK